MNIQGVIPTSVNNDLDVPGVKVGGIIQQSPTPSTSIIKSTTKSETLNPNGLPKIISRRFGCVDKERIYCVLTEGIRRYKDQQLIQVIIADDKKVFSIRNSELRGMILRHQHILARLVTPEEFHTAVENSLKNILRLTQQTGILLSSYAPNENESSLPDEFYRTLQEFSDLMKTRLLTGLEEETKLRKLQLEKLEKTRGFVTAIRSLTDTLQLKSKHKVFDLREKDKTVEQYLQDLNFIRLTSGTSINRSLNEATKQILQDRNHSKCLESKMKKDIVALTTSHSAKLVPDLKEETELRKRKTKMQVELLNWIEKYDEHMGRLQDELENEHHLHNIELNNLKQMEEHFAKLKEEYDIIVEEKHRQQKEAARQKKEEKERLRCCIKIQAAWRGYLYRTGFIGKKSKKDKKDKKKGGKKKKK